MLFKRTTLSEKKAFIVLSVLMFIFSAQISLTLYIDSSYLKDAISRTPSLSEKAVWANPDDMVGTIYTLASLVTILALLTAPRILRRFGNYLWTLGILILHSALLLALSMFDSAWLIIPIFMIETALTSILYFNFDVFLERYSKNENTGAIRGLFMMIGSIAWLLPPFLAGVIIERSGFQLVYLVGATIMVPTIFIIMRYFSHFEDLKYDDAPLLMSHDTAKKNPSIGHILSVNFCLHFFYAWMVIYSPIYFHDTLGISYGDFGIIMAFALTAFVLVPYPEGRISDKYIGEKELLILGFLLMGLTSLAIPYFSSHALSLFAWGALLFIGRIGAATVEAMAETYFFKQIDGGNTELMGHFRRSRPLAFIAAPLLASFLLQTNLITLSGLFTLLGGIMICAIYFPLRLVDTK